MLLVVISRSLWECHMNANPASPVGELAIVPDGGVVSGGADCADRCIGPEIGTAAVPGAVRKEVWIRQCHRAASRYIAERRHLERLVVVLAPLVIINRCRIPVL